VRGARDGRVVAELCGSWKASRTSAARGGHRSDKMTIYVQMPDTLSSTSQRLRVAGVYVRPGTGIEMKNWIATADTDLQTSDEAAGTPLASSGDQHAGSQWHWTRPRIPRRQVLKNGAHHPLNEQIGVPTSTKSAGAHRKRFCAVGGFRNRETIPDEDLQRSSTVRGDQIREFLNRVDTFTDRLNQQRDEHPNAIDRLIGC